MVRVQKKTALVLKLGATLISVAAAWSVVACSDGSSEEGFQGALAPDGGALVEPPSTGSVASKIDAGKGDGGASGVVSPPVHTSDAGAHPPPPPVNDAGVHQTDGGTKPPKDAGPLPSQDAAAEAGEDASSPPPSADAGSTGTTTDAGSTGSSSSAECTSASDCFAIPCGCEDGTTEYWQACGASGSCLGYGVCLYDQVCATHGGLYDPSAPPASCDDGDPTDCAPVACNCNDGTVLDYQACSGVSCATVSACGAAGDDICNAHDGWIGDAPTPPEQPCPDVVCSCPDGVTYVVPDERCLYDSVCDTDLVCSGD